MKGHLEHSFYLGPRPGAKGMAGVGGGGVFWKEPSSLKRPTGGSFPGDSGRRAFQAEGRALNFLVATLRKEQEKGN